MSTAWNPKYVLRPYQRDWCRGITDTFEQGHEGEEMTKLLGVAGTGGGKTIMASALMYAEHRKRGGRSLFLADRDKLVSQAVEKIYAATGMIAGREQAKDYASDDDVVIVGSVQTLQNAERRAAHRDKFGLVICDEAHLSLAPNWQAVLADFPSARILGITATPGRSDKRSLLSFYQHIPVSISTFDLIGLKALVPIMVRTCPVHIDASKAKAGEADQDEMAQAIEPYWEKILDHWQQHAGKRKTLFFHPTRKASRLFTALCLQRGISAAHIDGDSKDSDLILKRYARGDFQILNNAYLLSTGYDEPTIQCVCNLRVTTSRTLYQQIIGRGTRLWCPHGCNEYCQHEDAKRDLLILDFLFQFSSLGVMRPADLITESDEQKLAIQRRLEKGEVQLNIQEIDAVVTGEREQAMVKALRAKQKGKAKFYDARSLAAVMHIPALIDHESTARWELQQVTERQVEFLQKQGIDPDTIKDRGHASAVMDAIVKRYKENMATPRQVAMIAKWGVPQAHVLTFETASKIIEERFSSYRQKDG